MREQLNSLLTEHRLAQRQRQEEALELERLKDRLTHLEEAQKVLQGVAEGVQQHSHRAVADVVTRCLRAVFGEDAYEFKINFVQRRGKTEADLLLARGGMELSPVESTGGGVADVVSFGLRLAALILSRPKRRRLLCLDEPFRHLSRDHHATVRGLLETLSQELEIQILLITHSKQLACGRVVEL